MPTSYFRERAGLRARNPFRRPADEFEEPGVSPIVNQPMPLPAPVVEAAPTRAIAPPVIDPIELARGEYESKVPTGVGNRIIEALKTAGLGFLQGASRDPNNPLAAGLGGAVTGGAISAISPKTGRAYAFETLERPRIEDRMRREEAQRQKARQLEIDAQKYRETEAGIGLKEAQRAKALRPETPRTRTPLNVSGRGLYDLESGQFIPGTEPPPKTPTPSYRETYTGRLFDVDDPAQRAEYERIQSSGPRDRQGRFISRSDERASAPKVTKPKAAPKVVSISKVREYAKAKGITESDAVAEAMRDGYKIAR